LSSIRKITPEISIKLRLSFEKKKQLYALLKSLKPDNIDFPSGLSMEMSTDDDNTLVIKLSSKGGFGKIINTVDEILEHISIGVNVITNA
jgi:hypothetical protein